MIWSAGWTEGGVPYGLTLDEWRRHTRSEAPSAGWVRARDVLETLIRLQSPSGAHIELGRVTCVGEGMFRRAYAAEVDVVPDANALSTAWVALLPREDIDDDGSHASHSRELQLLATLHAHEQLPFRVPRPLGALPGPRGTVLAREFLRGSPLDLRAGRQPAIRPWEVVATIAASLHNLEARSLALPFESGPATRREHALRMLRTLDSLPLAEARDAAAWAAEHLPPEEPSALLHGDLLGQNILLDPSEQRPYAVIDWGCTAIGDPAYDLAIVTRGVRRPFQIDGGLDRLLETYDAVRGSRPRVTREHVRLYELCLAAQWCKDATAPASQGHCEPLADAAARLRRVLAMARSVRF